MKVVAVLVLLVVGINARSLEKRQGSTADRGILAALPIDISAQVANIQNQLAQITQTFTRILPVGQLGKRDASFMEGENGNGAGGAPSIPLVGNVVSMEMFTQQLSALQATLTGLLSQFTRVFSGFGGLLAEPGTTTSNGDQNAGFSGVPLLGQFTQQLQVLQQQLQSVMAQFTRAMGGLNGEQPTQSQTSNTEVPIIGQFTKQLQALQEQLQSMMAQFTRALGGMAADDSPSSSSTALSLPDFSQFQRLLNDLSLTLNQLLGSVTRIFGVGATGTGTH